jgi:hypothetical protein
LSEFHLALFRGSSADLILVEDYLRERVQTQVNPQWAAVSIVTGSREHLGARASLGPLERLVAQLEPARQRLLANQTALVRSGVLDVPQGTFLAFVPTGDDVRISVLQISELPMSDWFPDEDSAEALYAWVAAHFDALTLPRFEPFLFPRPELIAAFEREAAAGRAFLAEIGK